MTRPASALRVCLAIAALAVAVVVPAGPAGAGAAQFHGYSFTEDAPSGVVFGAVAVHPDPSFSSPGLLGCTAPLTGAPVYQPLWVGDNSGDWWEVGTDHQCLSNKYHYWGYATGGSFTLVGTERASAGTTHTFYISGADAPMAAVIEIDGVQKSPGSIPGLVLATSNAQAGMESYSSGSKFPATVDSSLKYRLSTGSTFYSWHATSTTIDAGMCGRATSATSYSYSEGVAC